MFPFDDVIMDVDIDYTGWRDDTETLSALLILRDGNPSVIEEFPYTRPAMTSFDVFETRLTKT